MQQGAKKPAPSLVMPWDRPEQAPADDPVQVSQAEPPVQAPPESSVTAAEHPSADPEAEKKPSAPAPEPTSAPVNRSADISAVQNYLKKTLASKPAVTAYLGQARKWEAEGDVLKIWFDNQVAFNLVKPEGPHFTEALGKVAMGVKNVEILEWEEDTGPAPDLDDFDRQVDLIAQVFRGERIMDKTEGEKK